MNRLLAVFLLSAVLAVSIADASSGRTFEDVRRAVNSRDRTSAGATVSLLSREDYRYTPAGSKKTSSSPSSTDIVHLGGKPSDSRCKCNCHVAEPGDAEPYKCFCVCPRAPAGQKGSRGPRGPRGDIGDRLPRGPTGDQGPRGWTGDVGPSGPRGERGEYGDQGVPGTDGRDGHDARGEVGPRGPKGDSEPGVRGPVGRTGMRGPRGEKGRRGIEKIGPIGLPGPRGPTGQRGHRGPRGAVGVAGERGRVGPTGADGMQAGPIDERSLYVRSLASAACASRAPEGDQVSVRAVFRSQASTIACGDTCQTICKRAGAGTCAGGVFIPTGKQGNRPASVPGELGLLSYRFPKKDCTSAGCDQSNFCCCVDDTAEYTSGPMKVGGVRAWFKADKIDTDDPEEIGKSYAVNMWNDRSGHKLAASAIDKTQRPRLELGRLNALPTMRFAYKTNRGTLSKSWLTMPRKGLDLSGDGFTLMAVVRPVSGHGPIFDYGVRPKAGYGFLLGRDSASNSFSVEMTIPGKTKTAKVSYTGAGGFVIATWQVDFGREMRAMINPMQENWAIKSEIPTGVTALTSDVLAGADTPSTDKGAPSIGHSSQKVADGAKGSQFVGDIAEIVLFEKVLSMPEIHEVECMFSKKWKVGTGHCPKKA